MTAFPFPSILQPITYGWTLENMSRSGGASISGAEQIVGSGSARWTCKMEIPLAREEWILAFRGWVAALDGRAGEIIIGPNDRYQPRDVYGRRSKAVQNLPYELDGDELAQTFDGVGFENQAIGGVTLAASAVVRSSRVEMAAAAPWMVPRSGNYFGIGGRLYICTMVSQASAAGNYIVQHRPLLRDAAANSAAVETFVPVTRMRFASDQPWDGMLEQGKWGRATFDLVEAV